MEERKTTSVQYITLERKCEIRLHGIAPPTGEEKKLVYFAAKKIANVTRTWKGKTPCTLDSLLKTLARFKELKNCDLKRIVLIAIATNGKNRFYMRTDCTLATYDIDLDYLCATNPTFDRVVLSNNKLYVGARYGMNPSKPVYWDALQQESKVRPDYAVHGTTTEAADLIENNGKGDGLKPMSRNAVHLVSVLSFATALDDFQNVGRANAEVIFVFDVKAWVANGGVVYMIGKVMLTAETIPLKFLTRYTRLEFAKWVQDKSQPGYSVPV